MPATISFLWSLFIAEQPERLSIITGFISYTSIFWTLANSILFLFNLQAVLLFYFLLLLLLFFYFCKLTINTIKSNHLYSVLILLNSWALFGTVDYKLLLKHLISRNQFSLDSIISLASPPHFLYVSLPISVLLTSEVQSFSDAYPYLFLSTLIPNESAFSHQESQWILNW